MGHCAEFIPLLPRHYQLFDLVSGKGYYWKGAPPISGLLWEHHGPGVLCQSQKEWQPFSSVMGRVLVIEGLRKVKGA